tara:strand:+ start:1355 stop:1486 length:132 start_codon:yes stop_codon:yes gene_type:complete
MPDFVKKVKVKEKDALKKRVAMQKAKEKGKNNYMYKGVRYAIN